MNFSFTSTKQCQAAYNSTDFKWISKHFAKFHLLFCLYFTSSYLLPYIYYNSTSGISVPYYPIRVLYSASEAPYCTISFTANYTLSFYSQSGNFIFPWWEYIVPNVGIIVILCRTDYDSLN